MTAATTQTIPASAVIPHGTAATGARLFLVPSRSEPGTDHVVAFINGNTSCTCDGSFFKGRCAHGRAVEDYLLAENRPVIDAATREAALAMLMAPRRTA